jgi:glycolate dehydrogenase FAD-binding subunit
MDAATQSSHTAIDSTIRKKFIDTLGTEGLHLAAPADSVHGVQPQLILEPPTESQLADALRLAKESKLAVIPRGGGTKLGWGNPPARADLILSTVRLNRVLEHASADLTVTAEAGCTIQTLQEMLAQHGQRLALDPLWPERASVGGILSTNDSGALRLRFGALRDLIIGVTIALPDGTLASSGGKVVKNVAGYDLPKLVTGALGTLGVITRAVFRLHPLPHYSRSFTTSLANPEETQKLVLAIQDSKLAHVALQTHFCLEAPPSIDIRFEGTEAGLGAQATRLRSLCKSAQISEVSSSIWSARQDLWSFSKPEETAIAKISILPTDLAHTIELISRAADPSHLTWKSLMYATGLGWLRFEGPSDNLHRALTTLRANVEKTGSSLVVLYRPSTLQAFDAWGTSGDSLPLMKSVKGRLDPNDILNPGRFLGGI